MSIAAVDSSAVLDRENSSPFREMLEGPKAFYNQPDYLETTRRDFAQAAPLPAHYIAKVDDKVKEIAWDKLVVLKVVVGTAIVGMFSLALLFRVVANGRRNSVRNLLITQALAIVWLSPILVLKKIRWQANSLRAKIPLEGDWKYKRITVEVNGDKVDATLVGRASTLNNGRWVLATGYEDKLTSNRSFMQLLSEVQGNAVIFNYPELGNPTKAYRVMLAFLEDQKKGIGAQEIVGYSYRFEGVVQADVLKTHELKKDVRYVFVKNKTFSYWDLLLPPTLNKIRQWVMPFGNPADSSKQLQAPEIILQAANVESYEELKESSKIRDDGMLKAKATLAKALLEDDKCPKHNKVFIGVPDHPTVELQNPTFLAQKVNALLKK